MRVVFAGGGTGGHLYPAIAIADALKRDHRAEITFVGTADRLETRIVPKAGYPLETISAAPFAASLNCISANLKGIAESMRILRRLRPDMVIATGGYVCFPLVVAARMMRPSMPIALLEPNAQPGLTNTLLAPLTTETWAAFPARDGRASRKTVVTGVPLRPEIGNAARIDRAQARETFGLDPAMNTLLVMGGSQGAQSLNRAIFTLVENGHVPAGWQILLVAGKAVHAPANANLHVIEYLNDVPGGYAAADVVLARAGASTLAELAAVGRPAILVPLPSTVVKQAENAEAYTALHPAIVITDAELQASFEQPAGPASQLLSRAILEASKLPVSADRRGVPDSLERILARIAGLLSRKPR